MKRDPKKGQISILVVFSLIPLFTLFAFVVNLGMLVNAKIQLQNAADLAAYAGAATQARQLTGISHLNYMMRQAYKKFLYRYYVVGNYAMRCYPRGSGTVPITADPSVTCNKFEDQDSFDWINPPYTKKFPGVPTVCISVSTSSNPCQLGEPIPLATAPSCLPLDPVCSELANAATQIQDIQKTACGAHKLMNLEIALRWLYSTTEDPLVTQPALTNVVRGIGLIPENIFNYSRVQTLQNYINADAIEVNGTSIQNLEKTADEAKVERSILAYKTAVGNLNSNVFQDRNAITMKELMPRGMLELKTIQPQLDIPVVFFEGENKTSNTCDLSLYTVPAKPILGVYKTGIQTENTDVFYAVKLTARAKLLFNPFPFGNPDPNGIELTAYAAAKPFGSRIGPELQDTDFYKTGSIPVGNTTQVIHYPFLKISDDSDYNKVGVLRSLGQIMQLAVVPGTSGTITVQQIQQATLAAQFPDEEEVGRYNIPVDAETSKNDSTTGMVRYFGSGSKSLDLNYDELAMNGFYQLWAPAVPVGESSSILKDKFRTEIEQNVSFSTTGTGGLNDPVGELKANLAKEMLQTIDSLVVTLQQKQNYNIAKIFDPLATSAFPEGSLPARPVIPGKISNLEQLTKLATSYTTDKDSNYYAAGRDGYSVKMFPMQFALASAQKKGENLKGEMGDVQKTQH